MKQTLLTVLSLVWTLALGAQTVVDIPFEQFPQLKVVATSVTLDLNAGGDVLGSDLVVEGGDGSYSYLWTSADGAELGHESTLRVNTAGDYYLRVSDGHQCQVTTKFTVTGTSGLDALEARGFRATLTAGVLQLSYAEQPLQVRLVSADGRLVWKAVALPADSCQTDLTELTAGTYLLCVVFADGKAMVVKLKK